MQYAPRLPTFSRFPFRQGLQRLPFAASILTPSRAQVRSLFVSLSQAVDESCDYKTFLRLRRCGNCWVSICRLEAPTSSHPHTPPAQRHMWRPMWA